MLIICILYTKKNPFHSSTQYFRVYSKSIIKLFNIFCNTRKQNEPQSKRPLDKKLSTTNINFPFNSPQKNKKKNSQV